MDGVFRSRQAEREYKLYKEVEAPLGFVTTVCKTTHDNKGAALGPVGAGLASTVIVSIPGLTNALVHCAMITELRGGRPVSSLLDQVRLRPDLLPGDRIGLVEIIDRSFERLS